jgi:hypothetical protein
MPELFPDSSQSRDSLISAPTEESLREFFRERIKEWRHPLMSGECFTVSTFSDLTERLEPQAAFALISSAFLILMDWDGSEISETALCLLSDLSTASETTEMPNALGEGWRELEAFVRRNHLTDSVEWRSLKAWYRQ